MTKKIIAASKYGISKDLIDSDALYVIEKLHKHSFDGYIVGGGIRDLLLNKTPKDFDIVTNATPELVRKVFKRNSLIIGRRFKIVHVTFDNINPDKMINNRPAIERHIIEISTYRSSKVHKHSISEHGRIMVDNNYGTQQEDSARRDFTINAIYYDPINEIIIDYHNGIKDIKDKVIRIIGEPYLRFTEDPVRMLRAIRLAVKLNLNIDEQTALCFAKIKHLLTHEHKGRLYEEMLKIFLSSHAMECILRLNQLRLPKNVFLLFDKLFFKPNMDQLALKILAKTDARLQENNNVSIIFILAGLLWNSINELWHKDLVTGESPRQALLNAIGATKAFAYNVGITKTAYSLMKDIWLLQFEFENPLAKRIEFVLHNPRFRQAWHLYAIRNELEQVDKKLFTWWETFIEADDNTKIVLLNQFKLINNLSQKKKRRVKRKTSNYKFNNN